MNYVRFQNADESFALASAEPAKPSSELVSKLETNLARIEIL
jgi:hypothetical protein